MANKDNGKSKAEIYREERKARLAQATKKNARKAKKNSKVSKLLKTVTAVVLAVAIVGLIGWRFADSSGFIQKNTTAMTIGDQKLSVRDFTYYYTLMYSYYAGQAKQAAQQGYSMGFDDTVPPDEQDYPTQEGEPQKTWAEELREQAIDRAQKYEMLYREAMKTGKYKLNDEEKKTIDEQIEKIRTIAAGGSLSLNAYLKGNYGKGINEKFLRSQLEKETIVQSYYEDKYEEFKKACTDKVISDIYNKDKDSYDVVNLRSFSFEGKDDATKKKADAMLAGITDEASFLRQAEKNTTVAKGKTYNADTETSAGYFYKSKSAIEGGISKEAADWAFADGRATGDKKVFKTDSAYVVLWVKTPQFPSATVDVRHILLSFKADPEDQSEATAEEKAAAKKKADEVYALYNKGKKTEDAFSALAKEHSTDPGSNTKGGLYDKMATGQMVAPFENWSFDSARKPGDTGIVETSYGYHIMYFVKKNPNEFAYKDAISQKQAEDNYAKYEEGLPKLPEYKVVSNNANIGKSMRNALDAIDNQIKQAKYASSYTG